MLRIATFPSWAIVFDGAEYAAMGRSLVQNGEFVRPYVAGVSYYRHYGPLYPAYLALFYAVFGFSVAVTKVASLALSVLFLAVVYATTKDLLGRTKAWFVTAFVALEPMFFITSVIGYSESLVGLLLVATVWAVVKGLRNPRYLLLAGLLAGLGFLAKASVGYVFVIAGVAGLLWRFRYAGLKVFRDRWYLSGIAAFGVVAGSWSLRNIARYGWPNWETSAYLESVYAYGVVHPDVLGWMLAVKVPWFILIFLFYGGLFLPELRQSLRRIREEQTSALWLTVGLVFLMAWLVSSFFRMVENQPLWWHDNMRYVVVGAPVILWAALRDVTPFVHLGERRMPSLWSFRQRFLILVSAFVIIGLVIVAFPTPYAHVAAIKDLQKHLRPGDVVGVDGLPVEEITLYLPDVNIIRYSSRFNGSFVLSARTATYDGFVLVSSYNTLDFMGGRYVSQLWMRADKFQSGLLASK